MQQRSAAARSTGTTRLRWKAPALDSAGIRVDDVYMHHQITEECAHVGLVKTQQAPRITPAVCDRCTTLKRDNFSSAYSGLWGKHKNMHKEHYLLDEGCADLMI